MLIKNQKFSIKYLSFFVLFSFLFSFLYSFFFIRYEASDDTTMMLISSGHFSNVPDYHLVFINVLYGWLVSSLEILKPGINWYGWLLVFFHIVSFSTILYCLEKLDFQKNQRWFLRFLVLSIFVFVTVNMQFTYIAANACFGGLLLILSNNGRGQILFGSFLFLVGGLIRFEASLVILFFFGIAYFFIYQKDSFKRKIVLLSILAIFSICFNVIDQYVYSVSSKEWSSFDELKDLRQSLNNNSQFRNLKDDFPEKFKANRYELDLLYNFFGDPEYFNLERIKEVKEVTDKATKNHLYMFRILDFLIPIGCISFIFLIVIRHNWKEKTYKKLSLIGAVIIVFIMVLLYINLNSRVNNRAFYSVSIGLWFFILLWIGNKFLFSKYKMGFRVVLSILILFFIGLSIKSVITNSIALQKTKKMEEWVSQYCEQNIFVFPGNETSTGNFRILNNEPYFQKLNFNFAGWISGAPFQKHNLKSYKQLLDENTLLFIGNSDIENTEKLIKVFEEVYGLEVEKKIVAQYLDVRLIAFEEIK